MTPFKHPLVNFNLTAPQDWDEDTFGACNVLPAHFDQTEQTFYSWWRLTWRERLKVLFGWPIRLNIVGIRHPPVCLQVEKN